jgi:hypothetical protein
MPNSDQKPDFSGEWILNREACTLSPGADAMRSATATIEHRDPTFKYRAEFVSDSGSRKVEYELLSDGREVRSTHQDATIVSRLHWEGEALITSWLVQRPDGEMSISFRYELVDGGRRLRAVEELRSRERNQDNTWIFDRRGLIEPRSDSSDVVSTSLTHPQFSGLSACS